MGVKMLQGPNVTVDQMSSGRSVRVKMSLGRSVGGRSIKAPQSWAMLWRNCCSQAALGEDLLAAAVAISSQATVVPHHLKPLSGVRIVK